MSNRHAELQALKQEIFESLHCALPGIVESFDAGTQTAVIRPAVKSRSGLELPLFRDVPVHMPVSFDVSAGDHCLVVFADCDIDAWFDSGEVSVPSSARMHSLSDGFAFVGFDSGGGQGGGGMDPDDYYDKAETDSLLSGKSDTNHTHDDRYYTEAETDIKLSGKKDTQRAVSDPAADGTGATFIDTLSQDAQGVISPHKRTVRSATSSQSGLMSSGDKSKLDGMAMISYGTCATAAGTAAKAVTISNPNWQLKAGSVIAVKFSNTNTFSATADSPVSLNVNGTGAKNIYWNNTASPTGTNTTAFGYANRIIYYMYDGTYWVWMGVSVELNDNTVPSAYCSTAAATAAKSASCSGYTLLSKSYIQVIVTQANTAASALTLNINSRGAKPVYINGTASSASNYTLPAGSYFVYYNGTNYYFRTDGYPPGPTLPVSLGGSGNTGTGATTTIADIAAAASGCTITAARYAYWGKVAMIHLTITKATAVSSGTTTLCTLASGKRPKYTAAATYGWAGGASISTGGAVQVNGAISANATLNIYATYILA